MVKYLNSITGGMALSLALAGAASAQPSDAPNYGDAVFCAAFAKQAAKLFEEQAKANPADESLSTNAEAAAETEQLALQWSRAYRESNSLSNAETEKVRPYVQQRFDSMTQAGDDAAFGELERCWIMFAPPA